MGLDMYLERMPRYKGATAKEVSAIENYLDWKQNKEDPQSGAKNCTLKKWCGLDYKDVPKGNMMKFYKPFFTVKYSAWDTEKKYGWGRITEQVGYWRKANEIHNWFVKHVQDGIDDCGYHHEVTKEILEELLDTCQTVLNSCTLVLGQIKNGETFKDGEWVPIMEDGYTIADSSVAEELLPTQSGFFFGGTSYDQWYVDDIKDTIDIITKVLETTDFDKEMIYYVSSW